MKTIFCLKMTIFLGVRKGYRKGKVTATRTHSQSPIKTNMAEYDIKLGCSRGFSRLILYPFRGIAGSSYRFSAALATARGDFSYFFFQIMHNEDSIFHCLKVH